VTTADITAETCSRTFFERNVSRRRSAVMATLAPFEPSNHPLRYLAHTPRIRTTSKKNLTSPQIDTTALYQVVCSIYPSRVIMQLKPLCMMPCVLIAKSSPRSIPLAFPVSRRSSIASPSRLRSVALRRVPCLALMVSPPSFFAYLSSSLPIPALTLQARMTMTSLPEVEANQGIGLLVDFYHECAAAGSLPAHLNQSVITLVHKKGAHDLLDNYRPNCSRFCCLQDPFTLPC
jgi:hypothetical protein